MSDATRLRRERRTMATMVDDYCRHHHATDGGTCERCTAFLAYADARLDHCPYGEEKPTCANCPIHCYKPEPREFAREVMRYAGPRMLLRHPVLAVMHLVDGRRKVAHPMEARRAARARDAAAGAAESKKA